MSVATRRQRERKERREAILDAAMRVFRRSGYAAATMDEVAAEAELSKGTLYLYFKNKDELFLSMSSCILDQIGERFHRVAHDSSQTAPQRLSSMVHAYARIVQANPNLFRTAVSWLSSVDQVDLDNDAFAKHRELVMRVLFSLTKVLTDGMAEGTIRTDIDPRAAAPQMWGAMLGTMLVRINADEFARHFPTPGNLDELVEVLAKVVTAGLAKTP